MTCFWVTADFPNETVSLRQNNSTVYLQTALMQGKRNTASSRPIALSTLIVFNLKTCTS